MQSFKQKIQELSNHFFDEVVGLRRHFHANPELSKKENNTAAFIAKTLKAKGVFYEEGIADTGIVAYIKGKNPNKKCIALRADMDALPIKEKNKTSYISKNKGVMHACGHDAHIASLLGAIFILHKLRNEFEGTIKCFFQPSEEVYPGGAIRMIKEGVLENPKPASMFAQHVYPQLDAGKVGMKIGKYMASTDEIFLTIKGKGGHAALPHQNIDPVLIASHIVVALQQIVSRNAIPSVPTVVSFGRFIADGLTNVIPDEVKLEGIVRTFDEKWRKKIHQKIEKISSSIAEGMGGLCEMKVSSGYPFLVNDETITSKTRKYAVDFLGENNVVDLDFRMTAEDFAYFSQKVPSCFYRLGVRNEEKGFTSNLHTNTFDIDENSLITGMGLMAWIAINELSETITV